MLAFTNERKYSFEHVEQYMCLFIVSDSFYVFIICMFGVSVAICGQYFRLN